MKNLMLNVKLVVTRLKQEKGFPAFPPLGNQLEKAYYT